ncbi:integrin alpha [Streptomyces hawaiiensis]|uniref:integrin alpha n=1 Tax=Streptomyces hawaiiensis TaxID=67305 RepID=UPI002482B165|nr:integrin alpha [Streptomyces hawaiiensis]
MARRPAHAAPASPSAAEKRHDDFNGDGQEDLAVAAPRGKVDRHARAGYVAAVHGSAKGPDLAPKQVISRRSHRHRHRHRLAPLRRGHPRHGRERLLPRHRFRSLTPY